MNYTSAPLQLGATGRPVQFLQARLGVATSSVFDAATQAALIAAQTKAGLTSDGVYGPLTNAALTGRHPETFDAVAQGIDVESKALQALVTVETAGSGFHPIGLPKILLERHYVYRLATPAQRAELPADICNATPGGYVGGLGEWSRFDRVASVDADLAIRSCSWGLAQIMGAQCDRFNMAPNDFMMQQALDEDAQIMFMCRFIAANAALRLALANKQWATVALLWNGVIFRENSYDTKLAAAYAAL
jgi:hypothetical protein